MPYVEKKHGVDLASDDDRMAWMFACLSYTACPLDDDAIDACTVYGAADADDECEACWAKHLGLDKPLRGQRAAFIIIDEWSTEPLPESQIYDLVKKLGERYEKAVSQWCQRADQKGWVVDWT